MASTSQCSVRYFVRWSRDPVTIITTPPGRPDVSNTFWRRREKEVGREKLEEEEEERVNDD